MNDADANARMAAALSTAAEQLALAAAGWREVGHALERASQGLRTWRQAIQRRRQAHSDPVDTPSQLPLKGSVPPQEGSQKYPGSV